MIYPDLTKTIGDTPLVELARLGHGLPSRIVAKLDIRFTLGILSPE